MKIESPEFKHVIQVANQHFRGIKVLRSNYRMFTCKWAVLVYMFLNVIMSYDILPEKYVEVFESFLTKIYHDGKFNWSTYPSLIPLEGIFSHNFNPETFSQPMTYLDAENMRLPFLQLPDGYSRFCLGISNVHEDTRIYHFFMVIVYKNPSGKRMFIASASASALARFEFSVKEIHMNELMRLFTEILEPQKIKSKNYSAIKDKLMVKYFYDPTTSPNVNPEKASVKEYVHYQTTTSTPLLFIIHGIETMVDKLFQELFSYPKKVKMGVMTRKQSVAALTVAKPGGTRKRGIR